MDSRIWSIKEGDGPLVAAAVHAGHRLREDVARYLALDEPGRLREEDPHTDEWTAAAPTSVIGLYSRFQVDLNRPRDKAVYRTPEDAWGLHLWRQEPPEDVLGRSLTEYDAFYKAMGALLRGVERRSGRFVVLDLHTYNHRRAGPDAPPADGEANPQVNLGTGSMDRSRWAPLVDRFTRDLAAYDFPSGRLDVRENVKFRGGNFSRWVHETFPQSGCALAVEFKKFFMDEWTGRPDPAMVRAIGQAIQSTVPGLLSELERM